MKKIAIIASASGIEAPKITEFFSEGNRLRVDCLVTDRENTACIPQMQTLGVDVLYFPREVWQDNPYSIVETLRGRGVDLVAVDDFSQELPAALVEAYPGAVLTLADTPADNDKAAIMQLYPAGDGVRESLLLESERDGDGIPSTLWPRAIVAAFDRLDNPAPATPPPYHTHSLPPTPDQEWAETLHIDYTGPQPPAVPVPQMQPQQPQPAPTGQMPQPGAAPLPQGQAPQMPSSNLLWAILSLVFCCAPASIVAIVFAARVSSLYYSGQYEASARASRNAEIWIIVSIVLGVVMSTFSLPLTLLGF